MRPGHDVAVVDVAMTHSHAVHMHVDMHVRAVVMSAMVTMVSFPTAVMVTAFMVVLVTVFFVIMFVILPFFAAVMTAHAARFAASTAAVHVHCDLRAT